MKEIEDREHEGAYRRQEMDTKLMGVAQGKNDVAAKICSCGNENPAGAKFFGACGKRLIMTDTNGTEY